METKPGDKIQPVDVDPYAEGTYSDNEGFEHFCENWEHQKDCLTIFLGSGASVGARNVDGSPLPTAYYLRNEIWRRFMMKGDERESFDPNNLGMMSLEHAAALIEAQVGVRPLREFVQRYCDTTGPLWQHAVLRFLDPQSIFTTNYDRLIEQGWSATAASGAYRHLDPIFRDDDAPKPGSVPLYKPHGSIEKWTQPISHGGLVLTQFDYFETLRSRQQLLRTFLTSLRDSCVLFIGYGFGDMDICSELYDMRKKGQQFNWYTVVPRDNPKIRRMYQSKYGIVQITRNCNDFFRHFDEAMNVIPPEWKFATVDDLISRNQILGRN